VFTGKLDHKNESGDNQKKSKSEWSSYLKISGYRRAKLYLGRGLGRELTKEIGHINNP